jgi:hypothetical protein
LKTFAPNAAGRTLPIPALQKILRHFIRYLLEYNWIRPIVPRCGGEVQSPSIAEQSLAEKDITDAPHFEKNLSFRRIILFVLCLSRETGRRKNEIGRTRLCLINCSTNKEKENEITSIAECHHNSSYLA